MTPTPLDLELLRAQSFAANLIASEIINQTVDDLLAAEHFAEDLDRLSSWSGEKNLINEVDNEVRNAQIVLNRVALMFENLGICA